MSGSEVKAQSVEDPFKRVEWRPRHLLGTFLAAVGTGVASALVCVVFRIVLRALEFLLTGHSGLLADDAAHLPLWRRALTPVAGALLATLVVHWSKRFIPGKEAADYVEAVRFENGLFHFPATVWRAVASSLSLASGAAVGREGSMIQFAASCVSRLGQRFKPGTLSLPILVSWGVAAAVAAVYNAPVAGIFFALEIVMGLDVFSWDAVRELPGLAISATAGTFISRALMDPNPLFLAARGMRFDWIDFLPVLATALLIGLSGPLYFYIIKGPKFFSRLPWPMLWSGAIVGLLSCSQPDTWGNGDSGVLSVMTGRASLETIALILLARSVATSACVASGVVGGVFTPTVFTGSVLGLFCGHAFHCFLPQASPEIGYAVLGIGCLLAAVTHAPWMAAFMAVELTGQTEWLWIILPACLLSLQVAKVFSGQSLYAVATPDPRRPARARDAGARRKQPIKHF